MHTIRVTKEFGFEAAHALWNYDGKCRQIHGHSYRLFVTVKGKLINDSENPKNGMVIDFGDLKKIVKREIVDIFDHAVLLNRLTPIESFANSKQVFDKLMITDYQPTCEYMVADFAKRIQKWLPSDILLHNLRLYETPTSFAEWFAEDNAV